MPDWTIAIILFIIVLAALAALRIRYPKLEVKSTDIALALVPMVLWLLLTGKITKLQVADLSFETAFTQAAAAKVEGQVAAVNLLPVRPVRLEIKGRVDRIPSLMQNKSEAVSFQLGYSGYQGQAVREYLNLADSSALKYAIFVDASGRFAAMADARAIWALLAKGDYTADDLARWISGNDLQSLSRLPGFLAAKDAIAGDLDKKKTLQKMETLSREILPVIDPNGKFAGVVDRARLTASLIIDISNRLQLGSR